jgi:hypothetical protein
MCRNFKWKIQGVNFIVDIFVVNLNNCDMVLRVNFIVVGFVGRHYIQLQRIMDVFLLAGSKSAAGGFRSY